MKILLCLFAAAMTVSAQTNLLISFTNSTGVFITNAEVAKILPNKIIYRTAAGGGTIRLDALPPEIQTRLGYNYTNAAKADFIDRLNKSMQNEAAQRQLEQAQATARFSAQRITTEKTARAIIGRVVQRLDGGLLVSGRPASDMEFVNYTSDAAWEKWNNRWTLPSTEGILFLVDYPNHAGMAADDKFLTVAFPDGFFKYTTVNGSESIVRRYTSSLDKATADALAEPSK